MLARWCFVVVALFPNLGLAETGVFGSFRLAATNVANIDPTTLAPAAPVDVYHVSLCNCNPLPLKSLQIGFEGDFINNNTASGVTFKETADLPVIGPYTVADSFFVVNDDVSLVLAVPGYTIDDGSVLRAAYTLIGAANLIPSMQERVIAVLSVPAGSPALDASIVRQPAADVGGQFSNFVFLPDNSTPCIPEPTSCILAIAGFGVIGSSIRRRNRATWSVGVA